MKEQEAIENIRAYGVYHDSGEKRKRVLFEEIGVPADQKADYVLLSGCHQPEGMPQVFSALRGFLDHFGVKYTFLSKEFCCGWLPLLQPAVMAKDEEQVRIKRKTAQEFAQQNIKQAEKLGAKAVVTVCAACEPNYGELQDTTNLEILHYPQLLARFFDGGTLDMEADYYLGCYRFRRMITPKTLDVDSMEAILGKIDELKLNRIDSKWCCFAPKHMKEILSSIETDIVITTCSGCMLNLEKATKERENFQVKLLPEIAWEAVKSRV
ncbi:MAG: (Fe-S)-binding protein [Syntrophaceae bacterium]|nr:(Fe-S)-binding protein [Syntrophaceae bacterium]